MNWHFTFMTAELSWIPGGGMFRNDADEKFFLRTWNLNHLYKTFLPTNVEAHFDQWSEQKKFYIAYIVFLFQGWLSYRICHHCTNCLFIVFHIKSGVSFNLLLENHFLNMYIYHLTALFIAYFNITNTNISLLDKMNMNISRI